MEIDNKLLEKIQKLLALATSPNEHEARLAAEKANQLLVQHNLSMADIQREKKERYVEDVLTRGKNFTVEDKYLWRIMTKHFFVKLMVSRGKVYFLGTKTNVEVAKYVYGFLARKYRELWQEFKKEKDLPARAKQSYYEGLSTGLSMQLSEQRAATVRKAAGDKLAEKAGGMAMMPEQINKETTAIAANMALTLTKDPELERIYEQRTKGGKSYTVSGNGYHDRNALTAGIQAGKNIRVSRGLTGGSTASGKLLGGK